MKTLIESLLDNDDKLFNRTDIYKNIMKSMPKKSAAIKLIPGTPSPTIRYEWYNPLFVDIINRDTIGINYETYPVVLHTTPYNTIYFLLNKRFTGHKIFIKVRNENYLKIGGRKVEAYETLTIIKNNLPAFVKFMADFDNSIDDMKFSSLNEFEKTILKYK